MQAATDQANKQQVIAQYLHGNSRETSSPRAQQRREAEFGPVDVDHLPPGHNAWNEPCVATAFPGMKEYAKN